MYSSGENALTINFGDEVDLETNNAVYQLYHTLLAKSDAWWLDVIPAYTSLTIVYDIVRIRKFHPAAFEWTKNQLVEMVEICDWNTVLPTRKVQIPVCYEEPYALDSKALCTQKKIKREELIELHIAQRYRVYMIGFLPGFPYMGSVDQRIAVPRLLKPRSLVYAGSVGIAGQQTGIYPLDSPGGWNIIGRTPVKLFDPGLPAKTQVALRPCDEVTFYPISKDEFTVFDHSTFEWPVS